MNLLSGFEGIYDKKNRIFFDAVLENIHHNVLPVYSLSFIGITSMRMSSSSF